jgi:hypothetical protein
MRLTLVLMLAIAVPQFVHAAPVHLLVHPNETVLKVVYPKGRDPIARQLAVVYYVPTDHADSPIGNVRAFAVHRPFSAQATRTELTTHTSIPFDAPLAHAEVIRQSPHAAPQLILFGTTAGSAGLTHTAIYTVSPTQLTEDSRLEKQCTDWALQRESTSTALYNRWMRAESIEDIRFVMRRVGGSEGQYVENKGVKLDPYCDLKVKE